MDTPTPKAAHPATDAPEDIGNSPTGTTQPTPSRGHRGRVALACQRCKRRKQRCDGVQPACKGCRKADVQCVYQRVIHPRYPGGKSLYISALEERIAFLEARMPEYGQDHFGTEPARIPSPAASDAPTSKRRPARRLSSAQSEDEDTSLVDGVAYLSLCASGTTDTAPEPFYLGSSSGATIARMIHSSIYGSPRLSLPSRASAGTQHVLRPTVPPIPRASVFGEGATCKFPPRAQAQALFGVFFDKLHTRWPILDRKLYYDLFEQQYSQGSAVSLPQRSILHLIYAISSRFLQLMKKDCHVDPQTHFAAAIEPMDYVLEQHNLVTVQFLVLLAIHGKRSPYGAGVWSQVRYALTTCVELGLHRARTKHSPGSNTRELEMRRRVFWACYCQDRTISILLGRTFGIADRDIDVELPSASAEFWDLTAPGAPPRDDPDGQAWSNVLPFIHIIKLRQLQSKIHRTVFRVDKDILSPSHQRTKLDHKISTLTTELEAWASAAPNPPNPNPLAQADGPDGAQHHHDFFALQHHKTILTLYTPLLPTLPPSSPHLAACARAASRACTAYKRLHQRKTLSYTAGALHSCFVAGLALVYCLWRDRALFSYQALEAARACSLCLTVFAERWPAGGAVVGYRDVFDALSAALFRAIVCPTGLGRTSGGAGAADGEGAVAEDRGRRGRLRITVRARSPASAAGGRARGGFVEVIGENAGDGGSGGGTAEREGGVQAEGGVMPLDAMVRGAVKEAFMVVDEEAPGGWQGWRMFSEMVQQGDALLAAADQGPTLQEAPLHAVDDGADMDWDAADDGQPDGSGYVALCYSDTRNGAHVV